MSQSTMECVRAGEKGVWISNATMNRLRRYVPGEGAALEDFRGKNEQATKKHKRMGVIFTNSESSQTSAPAPYPERKDGWSTFINVIRLVSQSCDHLSSEEEKLISERVHSQLKLEGKLDGLQELGMIPPEELQSFYALIDAYIAYFDKVKTEVGFKACEDTQLEAFHSAALCNSLREEIEGLEKTAQNGDENAKSRLADALRDLEVAEELLGKTENQAETARNDIKALVSK